MNLTLLAFNRSPYTHKQTLSLYAQAHTHSSERKSNTKKICNYSILYSFHIFYSFCYIILLCYDAKTQLIGEKRWWLINKYIKCFVFAFFFFFIFIFCFIWTALRFVSYIYYFSKHTLTILWVNLNFFFFKKKTNKTVADTKKAITLKVVLREKFCFFFNSHRILFHLNCCF